MSEYLLATEHVEGGFARYADLTDQASEAQAKIGFRKWLWHVQAEAWTKGAAAGLNHRDIGSPLTNPYQEANDD